MSTSLYHNARCSKSREALNVLKEHDVQCEVVEYMKVPLSSSDLQAIIQKLGITPYDLIRKKEKVFKEKFSTSDIEGTDWIQAMIDYPQLMERPILVSNNKAVIGRPPSNVLSIIPSSAF